MEIEIRINLDKLLIGDLLALDTMTPAEQIELLDRVVEGGVKHLPVTVLPQILEALQEAISNLGWAKN